VRRCPWLQRVEGAGNQELLEGQVHLLAVHETVEGTVVDPVRAGSSKAMAPRGVQPPTVPTCRRPIRMWCRIADQRRALYLSLPTGCR
jgi:hypothetical protein